MVLTGACTDPKTEGVSSFYRFYLIGSCHYMLVVVGNVCECLAEHILRVALLMFWSCGASKIGFHTTDR